MGATALHVHVKASGGEGEEGGWLLFGGVI